MLGGVCACVVLIHNFSPRRQIDRWLRTMVSLRPLETELYHNGSGIMQVLLRLVCCRCDYAVLAERTPEKDGSRRPTVFARPAAASMRAHHARSPDRSPAAADNDDDAGKCVRKRRSQPDSAREEVFRRDSSPFMSRGVPYSVLFPSHFAPCSKVHP